MDFLMYLLIIAQDAFNEDHIFFEFDDVYNDTMDVIMDLNVPASEKLAAIQLLRELKDKAETLSNLRKQIINEDFVDDEDEDPYVDDEDDYLSFLYRVPFPERL